ncbi:MAG: DUF1538 family protein [Clostridia bacterium]|nr:DUF1538 family protein [Clostridia bacterium]
MNFLKKLRDVSISILPIVVICLAIHFFVYRFSSNVILSFLLAVVIIILGETLFFLGVDASIIPMGEIVGNSSGNKAKVLVLIIFGFIFGLFATIAEPDVSVLANQTKALGLNLSPIVFTFITGFGVGAFVAFALFRIIAKLSFKIVLAIIMAIIVLISIFTDGRLVALAFDAGGATTGIITSPFLIAISTGVTRNKDGKQNSEAFGVIGIASLGPVLALLFFFLVSGKGLTSALSSGEEIISVGALLLSELKATSLSLLPLILFFFIYELIFVKLPTKKVLSLLFGALITFIGLYLFLFAIDFGFTNMGNELGKALAEQSNVLIIIFCVVLGFVITFSEPAVKILGKQIEDETGGYIKAKTVLISIAISMGVAVALSAVRIILDINFTYIVAFGYALALVLMIFCPSMFTGIGFDSGGVASGPITAAFVLPLMLGLAGGASGFGVISLVGLMPIIVIEILGIMYRIKVGALNIRSERNALRIAYEMDMLSSTARLKEEYLKAKAKRGRRNSVR